MPALLRAVPIAEAESLLPMLRDADEDEGRISEALSDPANTSYLALDGDTVIGATTVRWEILESEIVYIAVRPELRGRGYGKNLITAIINEMYRKGVQSLLVGTANSSIENIAFYQKCGFRLDHVKRDYFDYIKPPVMEYGILVRDMLVMKYEL